jgi:putative hydrolase of the HAD superfamily
MTIRAVLLDVVGTLLLPEPPVAAAYGAVAHEFGIERDTTDIERRFHEAFARQEQLDARDPQWWTDEARERRRWQAIVDEVFAPAAVPETMFERLWEHFARPEHWVAFEDAAAACARLAAAGLVLGAASNFDARLRNVLAGHPRLHVLTHVFASSELRCRKPGREFFRSIERALGLAPGELLLVGDDLENDYLAARAAGWQAVLVDRRGRHGHVPGAIASLEQLDAPRLLDGRAGATYL